MYTATVRVQSASGEAVRTLDRGVGTEYMRVVSADVA